MRKPSRIWLGPLLLFALLTIGADDCALTQIGKPVPPSSTSPALPYCSTDPPLGCVALCIFAPTDIPDMPPPPTTPTTTDNCTDPGSGTIAAQFITDVQTILECDPTLWGGASYVVFSTFFSLTRQVAQAGNCTPPPTLPDDEPLSTFMGF
jgi:hypothetical protein